MTHSADKPMTATEVLRRREQHAKDTAERFRRQEAIREDWYWVIELLLKDLPSEENRTMVGPVMKTLQTRKL